MGYSINMVAEFGMPFQVVHEQVVLVPAQGYLPVKNAARKLLFVLSGECRHQVVGWDGLWGEVHLRPGDIIALPHRCEQRYHGLEPGAASRLHVVRLSFDPERLPPLPLNFVRAGDSISPDPEIEEIVDRCLSDIRYLRAPQDPGLQETLSHLREEARQRLPGYRLRIHSLCTSLTILFFRKAAERRTEAVASEPQPGSEYHVGKIKDYLRGHVARPPRLTQVAGHVGLSEEYSVRLFKKITGMTIFEYSRRLRVTEAKNLLATTESNLSEIAQATGFASLTVFSRNFKREVGLTPSEFRQHIARQMG